MQKTCSDTKETKVHCDVLIIGAGPAGLTSAIYSARSKLQTVVIDSSIPGGQVASTFHVSNYPGTNGVIRGIDLMENMKKQALDFGAQIDDMQSIKSIDFSGDEKHLKTELNEYYAKSVIIATGAEPRKLPVEQERQFRGRGIHYCATCDGALYVDANVIVVGGGTSALQEALFLTRYAKTVTIINRSDSFKASRSSVDEVMKYPQIKIIWNTEVKEVHGENFVQKVILHNNTNGEQTEMGTDGVFVYIGMEPNTLLFKTNLKLSDNGYIITDANMSTNIPGVFAAGDVREKDIRQISTAVGDGTIAGIMVERYISGK
ncbi:MAG: thioredoxin-disulfide reductase [Bacillota bacterium]|nr:thioredoxin-disulfide reductase [Bacillota bacterium]